MKLVIEYKKSIEDFVKKEIANFSKFFNIIIPGLAIIDADYKELIVNSALVERVGLLVGYYSDIKELNFDFKDFLTEKHSFKVKCKDRNVCITLGQYVKDSTNALVSLEHPDKIIVAKKLKEKTIAYLIISGEQLLTNRGYSVSNNELLTADIARAMVDYSQWNNSGALLDPFCSQGYIIIETALKGLNVGVGYFKSKEVDFEIPKPKITKLSSELLCYSNDLNELKNSKKACKLARIFKYVKFGYHDLEDLDYKIKENTIDYLVTALPKRLNVEKLFFQLDYIMKKNCTLIFLTKHDLSISKKYGFKIIETKKIGSKDLIKIKR